MARSGELGELAAHLLHRLGFDLADAFGGHAVFGGQLVQGRGLAFGQPAALHDGAAALVELGQRGVQPFVLQVGVLALAWPNGNAREDLGDELAAMGLRAAFGTGRGAAGAPAEARWNLPRNNVDRGAAGNAGLLPWLLMRAR